MSIRRAIFAVVVVPLAAAAQPHAAPGAFSGARPAKREAVWPEAPEQARIRLVGVLQSESDIGKKSSGASLFKRAISGTTKSSLVGITRPHDVWVDGQNRTYVSDAGRRELVRFDPVKRSATTLGQTGTGRLVKPMGLDGDRDGNVYVADQSVKRVVMFNADGAFVRAFGGAQLLLNPVDVAVDQDVGRLYVADSYQHQILVFDVRDGRLLSRIGRTAGTLESAKAANMAPQRAHGGEPEPKAPWAKDTAGTGMLGHPSGYSPEPRDVVENRGSKQGEFRFPSFVSVSPAGHVVVSDALNFRAQVFDRTGRFVRAIGMQGSGPGQFARPKGVAMDAEERVYVADAAFSNIQIFDRQGRLLLAFGEMGSNEGELWMPEGLFVDREERIFVSDRFNNRIQVYQHVGRSVAAAPGAPSLR